MSLEALVIERAGKHFMNSSYYSGSLLGHESAAARAGNSLLFTAKCDKFSLKFIF